MKLSTIVPLALAAFLPSVSATPMEADASLAIRDNEGQVSAQGTSSGCYYFASPHCCVPTVCMCLDSRIYEINRDNQARGLHGCDPPWGLIANSYPEHPGSCCRAALDGSVIEGKEEA